MRLPNLARLALAVWLLWMSGCASSPDPLPVVVQAPRQALELPPLPAAVMDAPVPDYPAWLQAILSSSMARALPSWPASPTQPPTPAAR